MATIFPLKELEIIAQPQHEEEQAGNNDEESDGIGTPEPYVMVGPAFN
jgi:hypothetical protein